MTEAAPSGTELGRPGGVRADRARPDGSPWLSVVFGVLTIVAALLIFSWPAGSLVTIAVIFSLQLLVGGVFWLLAAVGSDGHAGGGRALPAILGVVAILVGILCLRTPFQTLAALTLLFGVFWVVGGLMEIVQAVVERKGSWGWGVASGLVSLAGGVVVLAWPVASLLTLVYLFAAVLLVYGVFRTAWGLFAGLARTPGGAGAARPATP